MAAQYNCVYAIVRLFAGLKSAFLNFVSAPWNDDQAIYLLLKPGISGRHFKKLLLLEI
jgi:hypothetical protein